jgi:hypothetical protein
MVVAILKMVVIMEEQNIMTLFIVVDFELVQEEVKEYFMLRRKEKLGKF